MSDQLIQDEIVDQDVVIDELPPPPLPEPSPLSSEEAQAVVSVGPKPSEAVNLFNLAQKHGVPVSEIQANKDGYNKPEFDYGSYEDLLVNSPHLAAALAKYQAHSAVADDLRTWDDIAKANKDLFAEPAHSMGDAVRLHFKQGAASGAAWAASIPGGLIAGLNYLVESPEALARGKPRTPASQLWSSQPLYWFHDIAKEAERELATKRQTLAQEYFVGPVAGFVTHPLNFVVPGIGGAIAKAEAAVVSTAAKAAPTLWSKVINKAIGEVGPVRGVTLMAGEMQLIDTVTASIQENQEAGRPFTPTVNQISKAAVNAVITTLTTRLAANANFELIPSRATPLKTIKQKVGATALDTGTEAADSGGSTISEMVFEDNGTTWTDVVKNSIKGGTGVLPLASANLFSRKQKAAATIQDAMDAQKDMDKSGSLARMAVLAQNSTSIELLGQSPSTQVELMRASFGEENAETRIDLQVLTEYLEKNGKDATQYLTQMGAKVEGPEAVFDSGMLFQNMYKDHAAFYAENARVGTMNLSGADARDSMVNVLEAIERSEKEMEANDKVPRLPSGAIDDSDQLAEALQQQIKSAIGKQVQGTKPGVKANLTRDNLALAVSMYRSAAETLNRVQGVTEWTPKKVFDAFNLTVTGKDAGIALAEEQAAASKKNESGPVTEQAPQAVTESKPLAQDNIGQYFVGSRRINLAKDANASTLTHELSHHLLQMVDFTRSTLGDKATVFNEEISGLQKWWGENADHMYDLMEQSEKDVINTLGGKDFFRSEVAKADFTKTHDLVNKAMHEYFARGFEKWTLEGKAPSPKMRSMFIRFAKYIADVYRDLRALNVNLSDDIRKVYGRLTTIEAEVEEQVARLHRPQFATKPDAMSEAEWQRWLSVTKEAREEAVEKIRAKIAREQAKSLEDMDLQFLARRAEEEITSQPEYASEQHILDTNDPFKYDDVVAMVGENQAQWMLQNGIATVDGTNSPDQVASLFGFPDAKYMFESWIMRQDITEAIYQRDQELQAMAKGEPSDVDSAEMIANDSYTDEELSQIAGRELGVIRGMKRRGLETKEGKKEAVEKVKEKTAEEKAAAKAKAKDKFMKFVAVSKEKAKIAKDKMDAVKATAKTQITALKDDAKIKADGQKTDAKLGKKELDERIAMAENALDDDLIAYRISQNKGDSASYANKATALTEKAVKLAMSGDINAAIDAAVEAAAFSKMSKASIKTEKAGIVAKSKEQIAEIKEKHDNKLTDLRKKMKDDIADLKDDAKIKADGQKGDEAGAITKLRERIDAAVGDDIIEYRMSKEPMTSNQYQKRSEDLAKQATEAAVKNKYEKAADLLVESRIYKKMSDKAVELVEEAEAIHQKNVEQGARDTAVLSKFEHKMIQASADAYFLSKPALFFRNSRFLEKADAQARKAAVHIAKGEINKSEMAKSQELWYRALAKSAAEILPEHTKALASIRKPDTKASRGNLINGSPWLLKFPDGTSMRLSSQNEATDAAADFNSRLNPGDKKALAVSSEGYLLAKNLLRNMAEGRQVGLPDGINSFKGVIDVIASGPLDIFPESVRNMTGPVRMGEMSIGDVLDIKDTMDSIDAAAARQNTATLRGKKEDIAAITADINTALAKLPQFDETAKQGLADKVGSFIKMTDTLSTLVHSVDGGKADGLFADLIAHPIAQGYDTFGALQNTYAGRFAKNRDLYTPSERIKRMKQAVKVDGVGREMSHWDRLKAAAMAGNMDGIQRLKENEGFTDAEIQAIVDSLDARDLSYLNEQSDIYEELKPQLAAKQAQRGEPPAKWDVAIPRQTNAGVLKGGHAHIAYLGEHVTMTNPMEDLIVGSGMNAIPSNGSMKQRMAVVKGKRVDFSPDVEIWHLQATLRDLAFHNLAVDLVKTIGPKSKGGQAISSKIGSENYGKLIKAIEYALAGPPGLSQWEAVLRTVRNNVSTATMAFNQFSAAINVSGFASANAHPDVHANFREATMALATDTDGSIRKMIYESSSVMKERIDSAGNLDIQDLVNQLEERPSKTALRKAGTYLMRKTQQVVDMPAWYAAYMTYKKQGKTHTKAVQMANRTLSDIMGGHRPTDVPVALRSELLRAMSMFMSFRFGQMNSLRQSWMRHGGSERSLGRFASQTFGTLAIPSMTYLLLGAALRGAPLGPDEDEDRAWWSRWGGYLFKTIGAELLSLNPVSSPAGSAMQGFPQQNLALRAIGSLGDVGRSVLEGKADPSELTADRIAEGDFDPALMKAVIRAMQLTSPYAGNEQIRRFLDYFTNKDEAGMQTAIFGMSKK